MLLKSLHLPISQVLSRLNLTIPSPQQQQQQQQKEDNFIQTKLIPTLISELDIGTDSLNHWRNSVSKYNNDFIGSKNYGFQNCQEEIAVTNFLKDSCSCSSSSSEKENLDIVLSPCVAATYDNGSNNSNSASIKKGKGFSLVARKDIRAGMFLVSVPTSSILVSQEESTDDQLEDGNSQSSGGGGGGGISKFLTDIDLLSAELLQSLVNNNGNNSNKFHNYAKFLHEHVTAPRNLPYRNIVSEISDEPPLPPPRSQLARHLVAGYESRFNMLEENESTNSLLQDVPEHYRRWAVSMVLSRRIGGSMMVPIVDLMNHASSRCNCFYTMCDERSMTGLDLVDNLFSGVSNKNLLTPHLHAFAINPIKKGQHITMSYSDMDPAFEFFDVDEQEQESSSNDIKQTKNKVLIDSGQDMWELLYGFVPEMKTDSSLRALQQVSEVIVRSRIANRSDIFPKSK